MLKVFIGSSVLIAGAGSRSGASRAVLTMAEIGLFQMLVSPQVLNECKRNLRKKLPKALPVFAQLLASSDPEVVPEPPAEKLAQWELVIATKDAPILGAAILAQADRLLTLDVKDFTVEVGKISSINIQSPSDFIQQIRQAIGQGPSAGGKRPTLLDVDQGSHQLLAVDLGSREFRGAVVNLRGAILERLTFLTEGQKGDAALDLVRDLLRALTRAANAPILGIGIGTPGLTNPDDGVIREAVNLGWFKLHLADLLTKEFDQPIYVANDSHMAALGEYTFGANRGASNMLVLKIGQGIGSGIILDGHPYYGDGYGAGEIGHVVVDEKGQECTCGNCGCLETTTSTRAIIRSAREQAKRFPDSLLGQVSSLTWETIISALDAGDPAACSVVHQAGRFLGVAIANLVATLNIHRILIAGRVYQLGDAFINCALEETRCRTLPSMVADTQVSYSDLGSDIVILGSSAMVLKQELGVI